MSRCRILAGFAVLSMALAPPLQADDLGLGAEAPPSDLSWSGDLLLRQDWLRSWPAGDNESRLLFRLRYGPTWQIDDQWTLGSALRVNESSVGNEHLVDYNDNQRPRDLALDTLYLSYAPHGRPVAAGGEGRSAPGALAHALGPEPPARGSVLFRQAGHG